jgi:hypothetical protein
LLRPPTYAITAAFQDPVYFAVASAIPSKTRRLREKRQRDYEARRKTILKVIITRGHCRKRLKSTHANSKRPSVVGLPKQDFVLPTFELFDELLALETASSALSHMSSGSQVTHMTVIRQCILSHRKRILHFLLTKHVTQHTIEDYIHSTKMHLNGTWGTGVEILSFSHLMSINVYTYSQEMRRWVVFAPHHVDSAIELNLTKKSICFLHVYNHYEVISSIYNKPYKTTVGKLY